MTAISKFNSTGKATITWVVDNFANESSDKCSPDFFFPNNDQICLELYLHSNIKLQGNDTVVVFLRMLSCDKSELSVRYRLSILDVKKQKWNEKVIRDTLVIYNKSQMFKSYNVDRDYLLNYDNGLLVNGKVTFHCEVEIIEEDVSSGPEEAFKTCQDYEAFLADGKFTDVILKVGGQEFKAHKLFLAARSPVFAAMFEHECKEKQENVVEITDVSVDVVKELIRFIYSGKTPDLEQFAPELLAAADKYQLDCLKSLCGRYLASKLDVESVIETLLLADLHQVAELKSKCIEFINNKRGTQVMATEGWKRLMAPNHMELLAELFKSISIKDED